MRSRLYERALSTASIFVLATTVEYFAFSHREVTGALLGGLRFAVIGMAGAWIGEWWAARRRRSGDDTRAAPELRSRRSGAGPGGGRYRD